MEDLDQSLIFEKYIACGEIGLAEWIIDKFYGNAWLSIKGKSSYSASLWDAPMKLWIVKDEAYLQREVMSYLSRQVHEMKIEYSFCFEILCAEKLLSTQAKQKLIWNHVKNLFIDDTFLDRMNNADPDVLPIKDGQLIHLPSGRIRDRIPSDLFTFELPVAMLASDHPLSNMQRFMNQVSCENLEVLRYLSMLCGACLTGRNNLRSMFIWHGTGKNGKTALLRLLKACLGQYYVTLDKKALIVCPRSTKPVHDEYLMPLKTARVAVHSETEVFDHLNEAIIKACTGDSDISVRAAHAHAGQSMRVTAKLIIDTNFFLSFNANDPATVARILALRFMAKFDEEIQEASCGMYPANKAFIDSLETTHLNEVFTYFARAAAMLYAKDFRLEKPKLVKESIQEFIQMQNPVRHFVETSLEALPEGKSGQKHMLPEGDLVAEFRKWLASKRLVVEGRRYELLVKELCVALKPSRVVDTSKSVYYRYRLRYDLVMVNELGDLMNKAKVI